MDESESKGQVSSFPFMCQVDKWVGIILEPMKGK